MNKKKSTNQGIQVFIRCRPLLKSELLAPAPVEVHPEVNKILVREAGTDRSSVKTFSFDKVFGPNATQADIYAAVVAPVVPEVILGFNCTIFAYGQTGTGKTFTIEGGKSSNVHDKSENPLSGIIPRAMRHLFEELSSQKTEISVSFLELYNEEIFDLLSNADDHVKLKLFDCSSQKGSVVVQGLKVVPVTSMEEVYTILDKGCKKRRKAATLLNQMSSRSHTIFTVSVNVKENSSTIDKMRTGKLNLVDLAGSENIGRSGAIDKRAREAGNINQSLLSLGRVITSLCEKAVHIPYRESKLTRLLRDSLGGQSKTTVIATISPASAHCDETINTLEYAMRAKSILNKPQVNTQVTLTSLTKDYSKEINRLKKAIYDLGSKKGFYVPEECLSNWKRTLESRREDQLSVLYQIENLEKKSKSLDAIFTKNTVTLAETRKELEEKKIFQIELKAELEKERQIYEQQEAMLGVIVPLHDDLHDTLHKDLEQKASLEMELKMMKGKEKAAMEELRNVKDKIHNLNYNEAQCIEVFHKNMDDLSSKMNCQHERVKSLSLECNNYVSILKTGFESASYICENEFANLFKSFNELDEINNTFVENLKTVLQELKSEKMKSIDEFQAAHAFAIENFNVKALDKSLDDCETSLLNISTTIKNWEGDLASKAKVRQTVLKHLNNHGSNLESTTECVNALFCQLTKNLDEYRNIVSECESSEAVNKKLWNDQFFSIDKDLSALDTFCTDYILSEVEKTTQAHLSLKNYAATGIDLTSKLTKYCDTSIESMGALKKDLDANDVSSDTMKQMSDSMESSCATYKDLSAAVDKCSKTYQSLDGYFSDSEDIISKKLRPKVAACIQEASDCLAKLGDNLKLGLEENKCKVDTCVSMDKPVKTLRESTKNLTEFVESEISDFIQFVGHEFPSPSSSGGSLKGSGDTRRNDSKSASALTPDDEDTTFSQTFVESLEELSCESECPLCPSTQTNDNTLKIQAEVGSFISSKNPLTSGKTSYQPESASTSCASSLHTSPVRRPEAKNFVSIRRKFKFCNTESWCTSKLDISCEDD